MHGLDKWKNEFLHIVDIRIEHFTAHPNLYNALHVPSLSLKALKRKMEKLHSKYVEKAAINVIII